MLLQEYANENPFYERRLNLDKAAGVSVGPDDEKHKLQDKYRKTSEGDKAQMKKSEESGENKARATREKLLQQKEEIERLLEVKRHEDEEKFLKQKLEFEELQKQSAAFSYQQMAPQPSGRDDMQSLYEDEREIPAVDETVKTQAKLTTMKPKIEVAKGKVGKLHWVKQQQKIIEKVKAQQEIAKERESKQKPKFLLSFGKVNPAPAIEKDVNVPKIDASTFLKRLKEDRMRNTDNATREDENKSNKYNDSMNLEDIPLPSLGAPPTAANNQMTEDMKLLGIDSDSTTVMPITNPAPSMAARKPANYDSARESRQNQRDNLQVDGKRLCF